MPDEDEEPESRVAEGIRFGIWIGVAVSLAGMAAGFLSSGWLGLFALLAIGERTVNAVQSLGLRGHFMRELAAARRVIAKSHFDDGVQQLKQLASAGDYHGSSIAQYHAALARHLQGDEAAALAELERLEQMPGVLAISESRALGAYLRAEIEAFAGRRAEAEAWQKEGAQRTVGVAKSRPPFLVDALFAVGGNDRVALDAAAAGLDRSELGEARVRLLDVLAAYFVDPSLRDGELSLVIERAQIAKALIAVLREHWPELRAFFELHNL